MAAPAGRLTSPGVSPGAARLACRGALAAALALLVSACLPYRDAANAGSVPRPSAELPRALRGVWFPADGARADCAAYRRADAALVERTGNDPLIGALVVTHDRVHRYAEYGEGDVLRVTHVLPDGKGAWRVAGWLTVDYIGQPGDGMVETHRFAVSNGSGTLVTDLAGGRAHVRCGDVRSDLYSAD